LLKLKGRTAVVTGAAGGIGRAIAVSLARRGCHLALADIDDAALARTAADIAGNEVKEIIRISRHRLDVADRAAVSAFPAQVIAEHGGVDVVVNNAGVALGGTFLEVAESDFDWLFGNQFLGRGADDARVPAAPAKQRGSAAGQCFEPVRSDRAAGADRVRGEQIRRPRLFGVAGHELSGARIGVTVVHPGGIATSIAKNARLPDSLTADEVAQRREFFDSFLTIPPEIAGETIVRGVENRRARILVGSDCKFAALVERLMPVSYWKWLGPGVKK
jgi:NAD(P)-dependent dehydrogenase (short-subunit alcohol dehydrogenase family)